MLSDRLKRAGCKSNHAKGEANLLIVKTAVEAANQCDVVLVGDDTDLVLLCSYSKEGSNRIFFAPGTKDGVNINIS